MRGELLSERTGTRGRTLSSVPPTTMGRMATTKKSPRCKRTSIVAPAAFGLTAVLFTFGTFGVLVT